MFLLLENGDNLLLESGDLYLLEDGSSVVVSAHGYVCMTVAAPYVTLTSSKDC